MSWDALIGKTSDANFVKPAEDADFVAIGKPAEIHAQLEASIPGIEWSSPSAGRVARDDFSLEFLLMGKTPANPATEEPQPPLTPEGEVHAIGVSARGGGDPVALLVTLAKANRWSVLDSQSGEWIDLNAADRQSWERFTGFREQVLRENGAAGPRGKGGIASNLLISAVVFVALAIAIRKWLR